MPTVINRHHFTGKALPQTSVYIGRGTPLGNPFTREEHGERALELYRAWLRKKLDERDASVLGALNAITPAHHLVCSCSPRPCHGEVVLEVWEWLTGKGHWYEEEGMIVAVTGGRDYRMSEIEAEELRALLHRLRPVRFVHGCATGVDTDAARIAGEICGVVLGIPANWSEYGRSAGPKRNAEMVSEADALIAFPGGRGTGDCVRRAQRKGIPIYFIPAAQHPRQ